jgi:hypothetical protein
MKSPFCLCVCMCTPLNNYWMPEPILTKLGMHIMPPPPISTAYFSNTKTVTSQIFEAIILKLLECLNQRSWKLTCAIMASGGISTLYSINSTPQWKENQQNFLFDGKPGSWITTLCVCEWYTLDSETTGRIPRNVVWALWQWRPLQSLHS